MVLSTEDILRLQKDSRDDYFKHKAKQINYESQQNMINVAIDMAAQHMRGNMLAILSVGLRNNAIR